MMLAGTPSAVRISSSLAALLLALPMACGDGGSGAGERRPAAGGAGGAEGPGGRGGAGGAAPQRPPAADAGAGPVATGPLPPLVPSNSPCPPYVAGQKLDVCTAGYLGSAMDDELDEVAVASDGSLLVAGAVPGNDF